MPAVSASRSAGVSASSSAPCSSSRVGAAFVTTDFVVLLFLVAMIISSIALLHITGFLADLTGKVLEALQVRCPNVPAAAARATVRVEWEHVNSIMRRDALDAADLVVLRE